MPEGLILLKLAGPAYVICTKLATFQSREMLQNISNLLRYFFKKVHFSHLNAPVEDHFFQNSYFNHIYTFPTAVSSPENRTLQLPIRTLESAYVGFTQTPRPMINNGKKLLQVRPDEISTSSIYRTLLNLLL